MDIEVLGGDECGGGNSVRGFLVKGGSSKDSSFVTSCMSIRSVFVVALGIGRGD